MATMPICSRGEGRARPSRLALATCGIRTEIDALGRRAPKCQAALLASALASLRSALPSPHQLAENVETLRRQKYDNQLPDALLRDAFARSRLDMIGLAEFLQAGCSAS